MNINKILAFNAERFDLHQSMREESGEIMDAYWTRLANFIASDVAGAIDFLCHSPDCTDEIFSDWSEVFDDVARMTQSCRFVDALDIAAQRFPAAMQKFNIADSIASARAELR